MRLAVVLVATVVLPGCYTIGSSAINDESRLEQIVVGETTKAEVLMLLGRPMTSFSDGGFVDVWTYQFTQARANPAQFIPLVGLFVLPEVESRTLTVNFNHGGVVSRVGRSETHIGADKSPPSAQETARPTKKQPPGKRLGGAAS